MSKKLQDDRMPVGIPWFLNVSAMSIGHQNGFQDASTDNANYTVDTKDDTRTIGVSVAF